MRLLGHPVHAMLVHFPMAFLLATPLLDALALVSGDARGWALGFVCGAAGVASAVLAAGAGLAELPGLAGPVATTGLRHAGVMLLAVCVFTVALVVRGGLASPEGAARLVVLGLDGLGALGLSLGGWLGGELVFRHGVGQRGPSDPG